MKKYFILTLLSYSTLTFANPLDPQVVNGSASFLQENNELNINCSDKSIINWKNFSIDKGEITRFIQPDSKSVVLNKVIGQDPSLILGSLQANGKVFLLNPNGILISETGKIDVGGFLASTLDIKNEDFLFNDNFELLGDSSAKIVNLGQIESLGDVYIIAKAIDNQGQVTAKEGKVGIAAAANVLIKPGQEETLYIQPDLASLDKEAVGIDNSGLIQAMQAEVKADGSSYELAIRHTGKIEATSIEQKGGAVYLIANGGRIHVKDGQIVAKKENDGGLVEILGKEMILEEKSKIDVTNINNGGRVYIGGGKQGKNPDFINAERNYIGKEVVIDASSKEIGNGGEVIVWADDQTVFLGTIYNKGGAIKGDGGFNEVSGLKNLIYEGFTDTVSKNGALGTLLLDPYNMFIRNVGGINMTLSGGVYFPTATGAILTDAQITTALNAGNLIINTSGASPAGADAGTITVDTTVVSITPSAGHGNLSIIADSSITLGNVVTITFVDTSKTFTCTAGNAGNGSINFNANFTLSNAASATFTSNGTGVITTVAAAAAKVITFSVVPTISFISAGSGDITLGATAALATVNFGSAATTVNMTTNTGSINFGSGVAAAGAALIEAGTSPATTVLTVSSGNNITFNFGSVAAATYTFSNFGNIKFYAANAISSTTISTAASTLTFTNVPTIEFRTTTGSIQLGQGTSTVARTINFGNASTINMTTLAANQDITLGGTGGSGGLTIQAGSAATLNVTPTRFIILDGIGPGTTTIQSFGTINFFSPPPTVPTSGNLNLLRPTIILASIQNLYINPYDITFGGTTAFNINNTILASITTQLPAGITFPSTFSFTDIATNLTINAKSITVNRNITDTSTTGSITLNSDGDIIVQSVASAIAAQVGVFTGNVRINAGRDLTVMGGQNAGFAAGSFAQIGFATAGTNSDIYLTVGRDILVQGGLSTAVNARCYALIGHGGGSPAIGIRQGNIIFNSVGRNVSIVANDNSGGASPASGVEGAAHIGHFALDATFDVTLIGDIRGPTSGSRAIIPGFLDVDGGTRDQAAGLLGHASTNVTAGTTTITGNILIQCNESELDGRTAVSATGAAYAGIGHKVRFGALGLSGSISGSVDVKVLDNAVLIANGQGGAAFIGAYSSFGSTFDSTCAIDLSLVNVDVGGYLTCLGGITSGNAENNCIIGVFAQLAGASTTAQTKTNLNINVDKGFAFVSRLGAPSYISSGQIPTLGRTTNINVGMDFNLLGEAFSADLVAIDTLNLNVGGDLSVINKAPSPEATFISSENTMAITVGGSLYMDGYCISSFSSSNGGYGYIRNNGGSGSGNMTILIGENLHMNPITRIQNNATGGQVTIVVDNDFPTPWQRGNGRVMMFMHASISTKSNASPIRIFTSEQSLNMIEVIDSSEFARINGQAFIPGTEFVNTSKEIWGVYYPSSLGGTVSPFVTFFYKNFPMISLDAILRLDPDFFISDFEIFNKPFYKFFSLWPDEPILRDDTVNNF
ncbi:MAG: filamentous hemagglutinin N-terminal domain-containing protein [Chlamydiae bacterium]|nr:filamentous hemagglutinin N-terminal domain-containing protein [Chlamydiota bacterium]